MFAKASFVFIALLTVDLAHTQNFKKDRFSFKNCDEDLVPLIIRNLTILPFPLRPGENLDGSISFDLKQTIGRQAITAVLSIRLKTGDSSYTEICDLLGQRNCYIKDLCYHIPKMKLCPKFLRHGEKCGCPIDKDNYVNTNFSIPTPRPPFELQGTFDISIELYELGNIIACVDVHVCLNKCMF